MNDCLYDLNSCLNGCTYLHIQILITIELIKEIINLYTYIGFLAEVRILFS